MRRLLLLLGIALICPPLPASAVRSEFIELALPDGRSVQAEIRIPLTRAGPLPAVMLFGGFEGTAEILERIRTEQPVVRASFRYPWTPPRKVRPGNIGEVLTDFRRAVDDTIAGVVALGEALRAHPDVDGQRISVVGASAGAPFAVFGAARAQLNGLVIVQGFGEVGDVIGRQFELALQRRDHAWAAPIGRWLGRFLAWHLELPAPEIDAARLTADQRVLMITATGDRQIPVHATEALWSALQASGAQAERLDLPGGHLRGYGDPAIDAILARAQDWLARRGLIGPG